MSGIPQMMRAVFLNDAGSLIIRETHVPTPGQGEVLVRMAASPINPSDLARIRDIGINERSSFIPGIEGSGTVVAAGKGLLPKLWMGKRVACNSAYSHSGTWAEYMVTQASHCFPLSKKISDEQGSMLLVNPMTAAAFIDIVKKGKHKAFINASAAGALGKMVLFLADKNGIPVINIVRNDKQTNILKAQGAKYIINSTDTNFSDQLSSLATKLYATIAFDSVGGEFTKVMLRALPYGGSIIIYGNLSGETPVVDHKMLVMEKKSVTGFFLGNYIKDHGMIKALQTLVQVRTLLKNDIKINVQGKYPLEKAQQAIENYLSHMSEGKVLMVK